MNKSELMKLSMSNLLRLRNRLNIDIESGIYESIDYLLLVEKVIDSINEDGDGSGVAMANAGTTSGMGNVVSSQPSSTPGSAFSGDGTVGSGDIGMPLGVYTKIGITGDKYVKMGKMDNSGSKKSKKVLSDISNFLSKNKKGKEKKGKKNLKDYGNVPNKKSVMNYQDFLKGNLVQVKNV